MGGLVETTESRERDGLEVDVKLFVLDVGRTALVNQSVLNQHTGPAQG